jgi:hypothetical protein
VTQASSGTKGDPTKGLQERAAKVAPYVLLGLLWAGWIGFTQYQVQNPGDNGCAWGWHAETQTTCATGNPVMQYLYYGGLAGSAAEIREPTSTSFVPARARPSVAYTNCTAARAAGAAPVLRGEPGYGRHLDRDSDGIGCE